MLKRISKALNKNLYLSKEIFLHKHSFDDVDYLVYDDDYNKYILTISTYEYVSINILYKEKIYNFYLILFDGNQREFGCRSHCSGNIKCEKLDSNTFENNFVLNKYDITQKEYESFVLSSDGYYLPFYIKNNIAFLGTWNNYIDRSLFLRMIGYLFDSFKNINTIEYKNLLYDPIIREKNWVHPDFYIPLPKSKEELHSRLSKKPRQRTKRERAILYEDFDSVIFENIPFQFASKNIIDTYYKYAFENRGITKEKSDITQRNITDVYFLKLNDEIVAIDCTCEQGKIAYWECGSYNKKYSEYSLGKVLYGLVLDRLIEKGLTGVSIGSIPLDYKKHYGSIEFVANSGTIIRKNTGLLGLLIKKNFNLNNILFKIQLIKHRLLHKKR